MVSITFPAVFFLDQKFYVDAGEAARADGLRICPEGTLLLKEFPKCERGGWIMDCEGWFVRLSFLGRRREWMSPLSWLWRFVLVEQLRGHPPELQAGELRENSAGRTPWTPTLVETVGANSVDTHADSDVLRGQP